MLEDSSSSEEECGREEKGRKGMAHAEGHSPPSAMERLRRTVFAYNLAEGKPFSSSIMSKRNKMDYWAARRRKVMAEKEMGHHS